MGISADVKSAIDDIITTSWNTRSGRTVPETSDVSLSNGAVMLDATYLYADMAGSSKLAQTAPDEVVAKVIRTYLNAATRLIRHYGGEIRSFDGDRVMGIFIGTDQSTKAVKAALAINWAVKQVIRPKIEKRWPSTLSDWTMHHGVGIDMGEAMIVRGGVRNNNDLVSIGSAPNVAAKLSDLRHESDIYISDAVYKDMGYSVTWSNDGKTFLWGNTYWPVIGGLKKTVHGATWWREP